MKKILIKRLVFTDIYGNRYIGATEYNGTLTDDNILGAFHQIDKTIWKHDQLWMLCDGIPTYHVTVEPFYQYQKRWYEILLDAVRRI